VSHCINLTNETVVIKNVPQLQQISDGRGLAIATTDLRCSAVILNSAPGPGQLFMAAPAGTVAQAIDFRVV